MFHPGCRSGAAHGSLMVDTLRIGDQTTPSLKLELDPSIYSTTNSPTVR
jgi:hypothetical protein